MNEPLRLRYTNQIVGAFLLILLLFVIGLSVLLLQATDYFVEHDMYWIEIAQEDVGELYKGADVMILGERAGNVDSIRYIDGSDRIRVSLKIDPTKSADIFTDSVVLMQRRFGLGKPTLVIRRAHRDRAIQAQPLPAGSRLENFRGEDDRIDQMAREVATVSDSVRKIQQKLEPTLTGIEQSANRFASSLDDSVDPAFASTQNASDSILATSEAVRPEVVETMQTIRTATENLESRIETLTKKIEQLVENDVRRTLADVRESTDDISDAAKGVNQSTQTASEDIAETLVALRLAAEQVQQLATETREVVRIVRKEAGDLPGTTRRVNDTVSDTQELVGEVRSHWLLRRYRDQATASQQLSPSSVRGGSAR